MWLPLVWKSQRLVKLRSGLDAQMRNRTLTLSLQFRLLPRTMTFPRCLTHCYWNHFNKRLAEVGQCLETPENVRNWKAFRGLQALESRCHSTFQLQSISIGCLEAPGWVGGIWKPSSESGNDYKAAREDTAASGPSQCSSHPSLCKWASGDSWRWTEVTKLGGHSHAPAALWWEWTWLFQPRCVRLVSRKHSPTTWLQSSRIISHQTLVS